MSKKRKIITLSIFLVLLVIAIILAIYFYATSHKNNKTRDQSAYQPNVQEIEEETAAEIDTSNQADSDAEEETATDNPAYDGEVKLLDLYSENGTTALFKCFDGEAETYDWEYYDMASKAWVTADPADIQIYEDELQRKISSYKVKAEKGNDGLMVRCTLHFPEKEDECQMASLFILKDKVKKIEIENIEAKANTYLSARELPVKVTYENGTDEVITGLNHLYFIVAEEKKDYSTAISGNRIETITQIITEYDYLYIGMEDKQEEIIRYHSDSISDEVIEAKTLITGKDLTAPDISDINISPFEVSNIDKPVTISVNISAEDDNTPYPYLEYAFLISEQEPTDTDWIKKPSFEVSIERNGIYTAYVRDQSGNIAQMEKEIITVDTKAPVISSVTLLNEEGWCKSNTIMVEAQDAGKMSYRFRSMTDGTYSDWSSYNEYSVNKNGTWIIQVKDGAGNISETEIMINNIDNEAPIIRSIHIK